MDYNKFYSIISNILKTDLATWLIDNENGYLKLSADHLLPLSIDRLTHDSLSIAHNSTLNGDIMADPDVVFKVTEGSAEPISFQNDYIGLYQEVYDGDKCDERIKAELLKFCVTWFKNIESSNYTIE